MESDARMSNRERTFVSSDLNVFRRLVSMYFVGILGSSAGSRPHFALTSGHGNQLLAVRTKGFGKTAIRNPRNVGPLRPFDHAVLGVKTKLLHLCDVMGRR